MFNLDNYLNEQLEKESNIAPETDYFRASDTGKCLRMRYMKRLGIDYTKKPDKRINRVFKAGDLFHDYLQGLTRRAGISIAQEGLVFDEDLQVVGHFDDLLDIDGKIRVADYKSKHSWGFKYLYDEGAQEDHIKQATLYAYLISKNGYVLANYEGDELKESIWYPPREIDEITIYYISKDDLRVAEFTYKKGLYLDSVIGEYKKLVKAFKEKKVPECTCEDMYGGAKDKDGVPKGVKYCVYNEGESCCSENLIK